MNTGVCRSAFRGAAALSHGFRLVLQRQNARIRSFSSQTAKTETDKPLTTIGRFRTPSWLKEKLGISYKRLPRLTVSARRHGQGLAGSNVPEWALILQRFERNCAASTYIGMACYVDAIAKNVEALPVDSQDLRIESSGGGKTRYWFGHRLDSQTDGPDRTIIKLRPRPLQELQCTIAHKDPGHQTISLCALTIHALPKPESLTSATPAELGIEVDDELEYVADIFAMVVRRFCAEMTFRSREEVASTFAEALLRVVQFRTPVLQINHLTLSTKFEGHSDWPAVGYNAVARWKSASQDPSSDQPDSSQVEVEVEQLRRDDTESAQDEGLEQDDESADDPELAVAAENEPPPRTDESTAGSRSVASLLKSLHRNASKSTLKLVRPPSADLNTRVGLPLEVIEYIWDKDHVNALDSLPRADLMALIRTTCSAAVGHSLSLACRVTKTIADDTPGNPAVVVTFRSFDGDVAHSESFGIPTRSMDLTVRANVESKPLISVTFAGTPWSRSQSNELATRPPAIRLDYKLEVPRVHGESEDHGGVPLQRIKDVVEAHLAPHTELKPGEPLQELVHRCRDAILRIEQPIAGLIYFSRVRIGASAYDANGDVVERADETVINTIRTKFEDGEEKVKSTRSGVFIALGSNVGDRFAAIESACQRIDEDPDMHIVKTSELFETEPMYVEDQGRFLNGVCQIKTSLEPMDLLDRLQAIENGLGRVKLIDKGPRNIDLDIVAYDQRQLNTDRLVIPHRLMLEREFVLRPLSSIGYGFVHPVTDQPVYSHLARLPKSANSAYALTALAPAVEPVRYLDPAQKTFIMSILNVTPDSFSDGGDNSPANREALQATAASHIAAGAAIIDIGGQSSRPNAPDIPAEEEIARILPAIEAIKSLAEAADVAVSVDTYRASVAEAAVKAGADIINDISAGLLDPEMLPTIARLGCTYIMMHMRGTPHTMQNEENTSYPGGVAKAIASELAHRLEAAQAAGIRRWRIILDPGVGFAKSTEQNVEILRDMKRIRGIDPRLKYLPWLVGTSRKGFIGKITGVEKASDRVAGTAATVTAAVAGGASIVRVHDVEEMARVVKMADAIYRK